MVPLTTIIALRIGQRLACGLEPGWRPACDGPRSQHWGNDHLNLLWAFPAGVGNPRRRRTLVQTTYTNPVRTTTFAGLLSALERPLVVPLLHLTIGLAPLVWLMNQLSYLNGSAIMSSKGSGFAGSESWQQIEHVTRLGVKAWRAVLARGMLGMLRYDATATLKTVTVPTLVIAGDHDTV